MDAHTSEATIRAFLPQIRQRLEEATSIAKAAEACSDTGHWQGRRNRARHRATYV